jgi:hypothetical protein
MIFLALRVRDCAQLCLGDDDEVAARRRVALPAAAGGRLRTQRAGAGAVPTCDAHAAPAVGVLCRRLTVRRPSIVVRSCDCLRPARLALLLHSEVGVQHTAVV